MIEFYHGSTMHNVLAKPVPSINAKMDLRCAMYTKYCSLGFLGEGNRRVRKSLIIQYISEKGSAGKKIAVQKICV